MNIYSRILLSLIKPVAEIEPDKLFEKAKQLKQTDGEGWAIGEMVERVARYIQMTIALSNELSTKQGTSSSIATFYPSDDEKYYETIIPEDRGY